MNRIIFFFLFLCPAIAGVQQLQPVLLEIIPLPEYGFTQGLFLKNNQLYLSHGLYEKSRVQVRSMTNLQQLLWQKNLPKDIFAEGCTVYKDVLYVLSWKEEQLFRFSLPDGENLETLAYKGEGWGLSHYKDVLVRSDGSERLYFHDPEDFEVLGGVNVTYNGVPLKSLNELEVVGDYVLANIWKQNHIAIVDIKSGEVKALVDCSELVMKTSAADRQYNVLNGIARDEKNGHFYLTGKNWPKLYRVDILFSFN